MAAVWRATGPRQNPPAQYAVYSTTTTEAAHQDDRVIDYRTYVSVSYTHLDVYKRQGLHELMNTEILNPVPEKQCRD